MKNSKPRRRHSGALIEWGFIVLVGLGLFAWLGGEITTAVDSANPFKRVAETVEGAS